MKTIFAAAISALILLTPATASFADSTGQFTGASNHVTNGGVTVTKNSDGTATVTFSGDFFFDGAPDPQVGFGNNGKFNKATLVGHLKSNNGQQTYTVPAGINVDDFNELYIWCVKFSVPLGVASLS